MDINSLVQPTVVNKPKRYWEVLDEYQKSGAVSPIQEWAAQQGPGYEAGGGDDNVLRRFSGQVDESLATGFGSGVDIPSLLGNSAQQATKFLGGNEEFQTTIGDAFEQLPRAVVDIGVPLAVGAAAGVVSGGTLGAPAALAARAALVGGAGAAALSSYGETGSPVAAAVVGGASLVMPGVAKTGGNMLAKRAGAKTGAELLESVTPGASKIMEKYGREKVLGELAGEIVPVGAAQWLSRFAGSQGSMNVVSALTDGAASAAVAADRGQSGYDAFLDSFRPANLVANVVSDLPFTAVFDVPEAIGQSRTAREIPNTLATVRKQEADAYRTVFQKLTGRMPSEEDVEYSMARIENPDDLLVQASRSVGNLRSIPFRTSEGNLGVLDAVDSVRKVAQASLQDRVGDAHDFVVFDALAIAEKENEKFTKGELIQRAATIVKAKLSKTVEANSEWVTNESNALDREVKEQKAQVEAERFLALIAPEILKDGLMVKNLGYKPAAAQAAAIVFGTAEQRIAVGVAATPSMTQGATQRNLTESIIDTIRGTSMKGKNEFVGLQSQMEDVVARLNLAEPNDPMRDDLIKEQAIVSEALAKSASRSAAEKPVYGEQLLADQTFAAQRAVLNYMESNPGFNPADPDQVRALFNKVNQASNQALLNWARAIDTQPYYNGEGDKPMVFETEADAKATIVRLNLEEEANAGTSKPSTVYSLSRRDGIFRITENKYFRTESLDTPVNLENDGNTADVLNDNNGQRLNDVGDLSEESSPWDALSDLDRDLGLKFVEDQFAAFDKLGLSPAGLAGAKSGVLQNATDAVFDLSNEQIASLFGVASTKSLRNIDELKQQVVSFLQYMRDGNKSELRFEKTSQRLLNTFDTLQDAEDFAAGLGSTVTIQRGQAGAQETYNVVQALSKPKYKMTHKVDINALKTYMGDRLAPKEASKFNTNRRAGMNFFEQFYVIMQEVRKQLPDPNSLRSYKRNGWIPQGLSDKIDYDNDVLVNWTNEVNNKVTVSGNAYGRNKYGRTEIVHFDKNNVIQKFVTPDGKPPLPLLIKHLTKTRGYIQAWSLFDLMKTYKADVDPVHYAMLEKLTSTSNTFGRNLPIHFGMERDPDNKGRIATTDNAIIGIMLSPFKQDKRVNGVLREMELPKNIAGTLVHELTHAHLHFTMLNGGSFYAEIRHIHKELVEHFDQEMMLLSGTPGFQRKVLHGLASPEEMLTAVWEEPEFMDYLRRVPDRYKRIEYQEKATLFGRLLASLRGVLDQLFGSKDAGTMLQKLRNASLTAMELQADAGQPSVGGDVFAAIGAADRRAVVSRKGDLLQVDHASPLPVPAPQDTTRTANPLKAPPQPFYAGVPESLMARVKERQEIKVEMAKLATGSQPEDAGSNARRVYLRSELDIIDAEIAQYRGTQVQQSKVTRQDDPLAPQGSVRLSAGGPFIWGLGGIINNKLGGKHTLPKTGLISEAQFQLIGGNRGNAVSKVEVDLVKMLIPKAFENGNVNVKLLFNELPKIDSAVETYRYGQVSESSEGLIEMHRLRGELDALGYHTVVANNGFEIDRFEDRNGQFVDQDDEGVDPRAAELMDEIIGAGYRFDENRGPAATSYYNTITSRNLESVKKWGGKSERVDVVLPDSLKPLWKADGLHENLPNTLGWAWTHELTYDYFLNEAPQMIAKLGLKPGDKVVQVDEQQSRWGQAKHRDKKNIVDHPLLDTQHVLVLKATIVAAQKSGAKYVFLPDGETAMMTEGHDKEGLRGFNQEYATEQQAKDKAVDLREKKFDKVEITASSTGWVVNAQKTKLDQSGGMNLHYNTRLPNAMAKLVGSRGVKVNDGGLHESGKSIYSSEDESVNREFPQGSNVFRNADNTRKTQISGTAYDISSLAGAMERQGGVALSGDRLTQVQQSRVSSDDVIDMITLHAAIMKDLGSTIFARPMSEARFTDLFSPMFDFTRTVLNGVQGFLINKADLQGVNTTMAPPKLPFVPKSAPTAFRAIEAVMLARGLDETSARGATRAVMRNVMLLQQADNTAWVNVSDQSKTGASGVFYGDLNVITLAVDGKAPVYASTVPSHEASHASGASRGSEHLFTPESIASYESLRTTIEDMLPADLVQLVADLENIAGKKLGDFYGRVGGNVYQDSDEIIANMVSLTGSALISKENPTAAGDLLMYGDSAFTAYVSQLVTQNELTMAGIEDFQKQGGISKQSLVTLTEAHSLLSKLSRGRDEVIKYEQDLATFRYMFPDMFSEHLKSSFNDAKDRLLLRSKVQVQNSTATKVIKTVEEELGLVPTAEKPSWWMRNVAQFNLIADQFPAARPFYDMLATASEVQNLSILKMWTALSGTATIGKRILWLGQFIKSDKMRKAWSELSRVQREAGEVTGLGMTDAQRTAMYKRNGLSDPEQATMEQVYSGVSNQVAYSASIVLKSHDLKGQHIAHLVLAKAGYTPELSKSLTASLYASFDFAKAGDAARSRDSLNQFMASVTDPELANKVISIVEENKRGLSDTEATLLSRMAFYLPERLSRKGYEQVTGKVAPDADGFNPKLFVVLDQMHERHVQQLIGIYGEEEGRRRGAMYDPSIELKTYLRDQSVTGLKAKWKKSKHREKMDMFGVQQDYFQMVVNSAKNQQIRMEQELLMADKGFTDPNLRELVNNHVENIMEPDTDLGRFIQLANFTYFMGGNISSMMVEPLQQLTALAPVLIKSGMSIPAAYKAIASAHVALIKSKTKGGKYTDEPNLAWAIDRAREGGVIDFGAFSDVYNNEDLALINQINTGGGYKEMTVFELLKNKVYVGATTLARFYGNMPAYNSEIAFIAAFRFEMSKPGATKEKAYANARFIKQTAMFGGGRMNRPVGLFSSKGGWRTASQAMWSLQSYTSSMLTLMGHNIKQSVAPKGAGLSAAQAAQVRKATVVMLATQFGMAGALGMPMAGAALMVLQQLFPEENFELEVRNTIAGLAGDNEALGGLLSSIIMTGPLSTIPYSPDIAARVGLGSVYGVSAYNGMEWKNFAGPTGSLITNIFEGVKAVANLDASTVSKEITPIGFRKLWDGLSQRNEFRDAKGDLMVDDLNPAEMVARSVGFNPLRVSKLRESKDLARRSQEARNAHRERKYSTWAQLYIDGKPTVAKLEIEAYVRDNPSVKIEDVVRGVSHRVAGKTLPRQFRDVGDRGTIAQNRGAIREAGTQKAAASEKERLALQTQIAADLGVAGARPRKAAWRRAAYIDELMAADPMASVAEGSASYEFGPQLWGS